MWRLLGIMAVGVGAALVARGEERDTVRHYILNPVVVTAQYEPTHYRRSLFPVEVVAESALQSLPVFTLADALWQQNGLQLWYDDVQGMAPEIDGIEASHVKVLWNGVPIPGRLKGVIDLHQIPLSNLQRIEIIKGPISTFYGSNSLGGAINVITTVPYSSQWHPQLLAMIDSRMAYRLSAGIAGGIGIIPVQVQIGMYQFPGYKEQPEARKYDFLPRQQYSLVAAASMPIKSLSAQVQAFSVWDELLNPLDPRKPSDTIAYDEKYRTYRALYMASLSGDLNRNLYLSLSLAYSRYSRQRLQARVSLPTGVTTILSDRSDTTRYEMGYSRGIVTVREVVPKLQLHGGYEVEYEHVTTPRLRQRQQALYEISSFLSARYQPWDMLTIQPSLRWGISRTTVLPLMPALHLGWQPTTQWQITAAVARGFRRPNAKELYLYFPFFWRGQLLYEIVGNEALRPETSWYAAVAAQWQVPVTAAVIQLQVRGFWNSVEDLIERVPVDSSGRTISYTNRAQYHTHGVEIKLRCLWSSTQLQAGITVTGRENTVVQRQGDVQGFFYTPDATLQIVQDLPWQGAQLTVRARYVGPRWGYRITEQGVEEGRIADYTMADIAVSQRFFEQKVFVALGIANLLDVRLISNTLAAIPRGQTEAPPQPVGWGRTGYVKLQLRF